ncbi:MAG: cobalamin-dependent protein [Verrucomicrobia bacterium]|nr:cobalamin-dependent protein [Verrucomicrobiota bacterium]
MRTCYLEPITLECLAAAAEEAGFEAQVVSGCVTEEDIRAAVRKGKPRVAGFSVHTYVYDTALLLAKVARETAHSLGYHLVTVFGGCHPSALPGEVASQPSVDFVVVGEGERTLQELLSVVADGGDAHNVRGLWFSENGQLVFTGRRERVCCLDDLPWPKRFPRFLNRAKQYQIAYPPPGRQVRIAQVMYSRGCPFSCMFCSSESTWGREAHWRSPSKVVDEIQFLADRYGTNLVYFPDLTFNANRQKVLDLCEEFVSRRPPVHWWGLFRADLLDKELLDSLAAAGCVKISLGMESPDDDIAQDVKGTYHAEHAGLHEILCYADNLGLIIKAFLIIGFPSETPELIRGYKDLLLDLPIDELRVTFATPFPGTRFYTECIKAGWLPDKPDWAKFTTEQPVLAHPTIPAVELEGLREELVTGFYIDNRYAKHAVSKVTKFPHLIDSWREYFRFLVTKDVFRGREQQAEKLITRLELCVSPARGQHGVHVSP